MFLYIFLNTTTGWLTIPYGFPNDDVAQQHIRDKRIHDRMDLTIYAKLPYSDEVHLTIQKILLHLGQKHMFVLREMKDDILATLEKHTECLK
jgi:hypothetical protein